MLLFIITILFFYAIILTIFYFLRNYRRTSFLDEKKYYDSLQTSTQFNIVEKLDALSKFHDIKSKFVPWYERSLSAVGIAAFFSMLIATGIQAVDSAKKAVDNERLSTDYENLKAKVNDAERLVVDISTTLKDIYYNTGEISPVAKEIMAYALEVFKKKNNYDSKKVIDFFEIALILHDYDSAITIIESNHTLLNELKWPDKITLAQYYYLRGADQNAQNIITELMSVISKIPNQWRFKIIVLRASMDAEFEDNENSYLQEASIVLNVSQKDAKIRLYKEIRSLNSAKYASLKQIHN